jgi:trans-aconitate methyltransferase
VLEVGCGWGRLSAALNGEFDVEGCDVSPQMLALVPLSLPTFRCDIASPDTWTGRSWDAVFTRGVLHYLDGDAVLLSNARRRLAAMGKTVVLWEIPEVCDSFAGCGFVLRPLMRREE